MVNLAFYFAIALAAASGVCTHYEWYGMAVYSGLAALIIAIVFK